MNDIRERPKILIVDDQPANLAALRWLLRDVGAEIIAGSSGTEALELCLHHELALILLDVQMPEMSGYEVAAFLQGAEQTRGIPVVFLTAAHADELHMLEGYDAGAVDYLQKPINDKVLLSKVKIFLEIHHRKLELERTARLLAEKNRQLQVEISEREHSEAKLRAITQSARDAIIAIDARGIVQLWNRGAEIIFGHERAEMLGQSVLRLIPRRYRRAHETGMDQSNHTGLLNLAGRVVELYGLRKNGEEFPLSISISTWAIGGHRHYSAVVRDITERVRDHEALKAAKLAAETANRTKSDFLAIVSHEIRTPLNGVLGMGELLLASDLSNTDRSRVETIIRSGDSLMAIINDILDFSKIEAGKLELERTTIDLRLLLEELSGLFWGFVRKQDIHYQQIVADDIPPFILGDPVRLRQVLINLLSNAVKFTREGGVTLSVRPVSRRDRMVTIRFDVQDTGIGISPEQFAKLFKSFSQVDSSTTRRFGGTGLGLSITQRLVTLMGGDIEVESTVDRGSLFRVTLPFETAREPEVEPARSLLERREIPDRARLLVVEDDEVNRMVIQGMLNPLGIQPVLAGNGREALEITEKRTFDLILMDCQMPEMDGYSACRALREREQRRGGVRSTPVVALTANAMKGDREKCMRAGMNDYLTKPVRGRDLRSALARWLTPESAKAGKPPDRPVVERRVLNRSVFAELEQDLDGHVLPVVNAFLQKLPERLTAIGGAIDGNDANTLRREAHTLKGASRQLGALILAEIAEKLENKGRADDLTATGSLLAALKREAPRVEAALKRMVGKEISSVLDKT